MHGNNIDEVLTLMQKIASRTENSDKDLQVIQALLLNNYESELTPEQRSRLGEIMEPRFTIGEWEASR